MMRDRVTARPSSEHPRPSRAKQLLCFSCWFLSAALIGLVSAVPGYAGSLTGSVADASGAVNLTAQGTSDWTRWGASSQNSFDRKATGGNKISNYAMAGPGSVVGTDSNGFANFNWTDGMPTASGTNTIAGSATSGVGNGFRFTVSAGTAPQVLKVYVGGYNSTGTLTASLSDNSAPTYTHSSVPATIGFRWVYTFVFAANSGGQTLNITWKQSADDGFADIVSLVAATLSPVSPIVEITKAVSPSGTRPPNTNLTYSVDFANTGHASASSVVITDPIPLNTDFKVGSATTNLRTTGLTVTIAYSNNGGTTWTYTPVSGAGGAPAGYDRTVTHVRWTFGGTLTQVSPNNSGSISFAVRIR